MIASDHIKFSDDGTEAWWVGHKRPPSLSLELSGESDHCCIPPNLDRPCDTCGGEGTVPAIQYQTEDCPDCHGSGRHCFEITVEWPVCEPECPVIHPGRTLTVSVVPGMVLSIVRNGICGVERHIVDQGTTGDDWHICSSLNAWQPVDLPSAAAAVGKTAVKLLIHPRP